MGQFVTLLPALLDFAGYFRGQTGSGSNTSCRSIVSGLTQPTRKFSNSATRDAKHRSFGLRKKEWLRRHPHAFWPAAFFP
jgi:hypothetical protein